MPSYRSPDTPTGPEQWEVIAWVLILGSLGIGGACLAMAFRYGSERPAAAVAFRNMGLWLIVMAVAGYAAKRLVRRFLD